MDCAWRGQGCGDSVKLAYETIDLQTRFPFVISRWGYAGHRNVVVTLTDSDGLQGMGEAAPNKYYGETPESVIAAFEQYAPVLQRADAWSLEATEAALEKALRFNCSARAAISSALHDLVGKRLGIPVYTLWGLDRSATPQSSFTIAIADNDGLRQRVTDATQYPILKIKLGTDRDEEIVRVVREAAPDKRLRVDANAAWSPAHAVRMTEFLAEMNVEMLEQPVAAEDIEGLRFVRERSRIPIFADESCQTVSDIPRLADAVDGINIKLAKCGSLREAIRMVHTARAVGMKVMAGCMIETSLGITAVAQLAPLLDAADFDGAALLEKDPYAGVTITAGNIVLPVGPGLGITRADPVRALA